LTEGTRENEEPVSLQNRVRTALETPVAAAEKLVAELPEDDVHERLGIQLDGWGRGIADALEEIALELDSLRERLFELDARVR
jgi:myo-inositol-1-phosphate synthase